LTGNSQPASSGSESLLVSSRWFRWDAAEFGEDRAGAGCAEPGGAGGEQRAGMGEGFDAAAGLEGDTTGAGGCPFAEVLGFRAGGAEPGGGLDEVGIGGLAEA
jgi:hypothetical protein